MAADLPPAPTWRNRSGLSAEFLRFVFVGALNTGVGYGAYLLALRFVGEQLAMAIAYAVGIVVAYLLNSLFVFRRSLAVSTAQRYPLVYIVQYATSALFLHVLVGWFRIDAHWAGLLALVLNVPVSFALNRLVLVVRKQPG